MKQIIIVVLLILLAGCQSDKSQPLEPIGPLDPSEVGKITQQLIIDGRSYRLDAFIWQDLMPVMNPENPRPSVISLSLIAEDSSAIGQFEFLHVSLYNDDLFWDDVISSWMKVTPEPFILRVDHSQGPFISDLDPKAFTVVVILEHKQELYFIKQMDVLTSFTY